MTAARRSKGWRVGVVRRRPRYAHDGRFWLAVFFLVALTASAAVEGPQRNDGAGSGPSDVPFLQATQRAMLQAFVLPQLSLECLVAIGGALATCTNPGLGGAVTCGVALLQVLETCPW